MAKNVKKIISTINNGVIQNQSEESSGDETEEDTQNTSNNDDDSDNWKESVKKYTKLDEKIKEKTSQKSKILMEIKKKYDMKSFNDQLKELKKQKINIENNLILFLEKTGEDEPTINLGSFGTLKLCISKKKIAIKPEIIEKSIRSVVIKKKLFESKTEMNKFLDVVMKTIELNRGENKKYLKKVKHE